MSASITDSRTLECRECGASTEGTTWLSVDVGERPALRTELMEPEFCLASCSNCGATYPRSDPLLILRLSPAAPIILACQLEALVNGNPLDETGELLDRARKNLGEDAGEVPGPVLLAPFDIVPIAAARDVAADAADPDDALAQLKRSDRAVGMYKLFLTDVRDSREERRRFLGLNRLLGVWGPDEIEAIFAEFPELRTADTLQHLHEQVGIAEEGEPRLVAESQLAVVQAACAGDYSAAWAAREQTVQNLAEGVTERVEELLARLEAIDDPDRADAVGQELLELARASEDPEWQLHAALRVAAAIHPVPGRGRRSHHERAIGLLEEALELLNAHPEIEPENGRVTVLQNLGASVAARTHGDPLANQERAVELAREALALVSFEKEPSIWAMVQTNLAHSLVELGRLELSVAWSAQSETAQQSAEQKFDEAIARFTEALRWRSRERDPLDWAYTEINHGLAYSHRLSGVRRANLNEALERYRHARQGFAEAGETELETWAIHNESDALLQLAGLEEVDEEERVTHLKEAEAASRGCVEQRADDPVGVELGRSCRQLGQVLAQRHGYTTETVDVYRRALDGLTPRMAPRECRDTAREFAAMASEAADWPVAAEAWEVAAEGAVAAIEARGSSRGRFDEVRESVNLFRFAAYALTRVERFERAVEILELGRARELAGWLQRDPAELERLQEADPTLCERFVAARAAVERVERRMRAGDEVSSYEAEAAGTELAAVTASVRKLPGFERFLSHPSFPDIQGAIPRGEVLVYPVTAPEGSAVLILHGQGEVHCVDLELTSVDVFPLFLEPDPQTGDAQGYLPALSSDDSDELDAAIAHLEAVLGPRMLHPVHAALHGSGARAVCLIPIGLLVFAPLHALAWEEGGTKRCLLDDYDVLVAPSALSRISCLERATETGAPRLALVVGNPLPHPVPLENAEREARVVATTVASDKVRLLVGPDATKQAVARRIAEADHRHFACHGQGAINPHSLDSGLELVHEEVLSAREFLDLNDFSPRLVVASACETALVSGYAEADEVLALSTVLIGAGAIGVIASLWAVPDLATAVLMTRFYELMQKGDLSPARALRHAQLWLRDLNDDEAVEFIERREHLRGGPEWRHADVRGPSQWAAFIQSGA